MTNETTTKLLGLVADMGRIVAQMATVIMAEAVAASAPTGAAARVVVPQTGTQPERLLAYLRQRPEAVGRRELREAFPHLNDNSLSAALTRLKDRNQIEVVGRGRYRIRTA